MYDENKRRVLIMHNSMLILAVVLSLLIGKKSMD